MTPEGGGGRGNCATHMDDSMSKEALYATDAGKLLLELTDFGYVK